MIPIVPKQIFFTKGVGFHKNKLQSFESALRDAGIECACSEWHRTPPWGKLTQEESL